MNSSLAAVCDLWLKQVKAASAAKVEHFDKKAEECWRYYAKDYDAIYGTGGNADWPTSRYKLRLAKARQFVSLMMPFCHQRVPTMVCTPAEMRLPPTLTALLPPEAMMAMSSSKQKKELRAALMEWLLNYLPYETDLSREAKIVLPEAFVKGRAILWTEAVQAPCGIVPANCAESVDNFLIDPDAIQLRDAGYVVRIRHRSAYRIEEDFREFGITASMLRSQETSRWLDALATGAMGIDRYRNRGPDESRGDVVTYFEIFSRVGVGNIFRDSPKDLQPLSDAVESLGGNVWLAVCPGVERPLNLSPEMMQEAAMNGGTSDTIAAALRWPIATHEDFSNPWPVQVLDFLPNNDNPWSTSPLWGSVPLLRFLDGAYNFVFERLHCTSKDIHIFSQAWEQAVKDAAERGVDQTIVYVQGKPGEDLKNNYATLSFQELKQELFTSIRMAQQEVEQFTGMTPLLSGAEDARQVRVAADIEARERHVSSRPQDYADAVEEWMGRNGRALGVASRLIVEPSVIARIAGEPEPEPGQMPDQGWGPVTMAWLQSGLSTDDPVEAAAELDYSVESGSGRRKNQAKNMNDMAQIMQSFGPMVVQMAQAGNVAPWNAMATMLGEGLGRDMTDFLLSGPPPTPTSQPNTPAEPQPQGAA